MTLSFWPLLAYTFTLMVVASAITWAALHGYYAMRLAAVERRQETADEFLDRMGGGR